MVAVAVFYPFDDDDNYLEAFEYDISNL